MTSKKLTPSQIAGLGGYAAAVSLGTEGVKTRGAKGGLTTAERYGPGHFKRVAYIRWGKLPKVSA